MNTVFSQDKTITIYYFSGTGNTQIIADKIIEQFKEKGFSIKGKRIEEVGSIEVNNNEIIGIAFPVAAFSTYPFVFRFIHNLPPVKSIPLFGFSTMGGTSFGGIVGELRSILSRKGYSPVGFREFVMPPNIFVKIPEAMRKRRIERSFQKANSYVDMLISGKARWNRIPLVSRLMFVINSQMFKLTELHIHQKLLKIRVDHGMCTRCGICVTKCPARNITSNSKIIIGNKCQYCFRCVAVCPSAATFGVLSPRSLHYKAEHSHL
jgi:flavodoxin/ferredoxin